MSKDQMRLDQANKLISNLYERSVLMDRPIDTMEIVMLATQLQKMGMNIDIPQ